MLASPRQRRRRRLRAYRASSAPSTACRQKADTSRDKLTRLVLKELADNGLDADAVVEVGELPKGRGYFVDDDGPGARWLHEINTACGQF
jgi:hypothetical protein